MADLAQILEAAINLVGATGGRPLLVQIGGRAGTAVAGSNDDEKPIWGFAELQATPGTRTLIRLWCVDTYAESAFRALCQVLVDDLVKLGALELPEASKGPIGFHIDRTKLGRVIPGKVSFAPRTDVTPKGPDAASPQPPTPQTD